MKWKIAGLTVIVLILAGILVYPYRYTLYLYFSSPRINSKGGDITIANAPILGTTLGVENTYGALEGRTPANPLTYGRITTDDSAGTIRAYFGEGELTNDKLETFGTRAVAHIPKLQRLLRYICSSGFEHHAVMTCSKSAARWFHRVRLPGAASICWESESIASYQMPASASAWGLDVEGSPSFRWSSGLGVTRLRPPPTMRS